MSRIIDLVRDVLRNDRSAITIRNEVPVALPFRRVAGEFGDKGSPPKPFIQIK